MRVLFFDKENNSDAVLKVSYAVYTEELSSFYDESGMYLYSMDDTKYGIRNITKTEVDTLIMELFKTGKFDLRNYDLELL